MAPCLKRLVALLVVLAFLSGSWASLLPCAMAQTHWRTAAGMARDSAPPKAPVLDCLTHSGCIVTPAVAAWPPSLPVAPRRAAMHYDNGAPRLSGLIVKPDLFPPILAS